MRNRSVRPQAAALVDVGVDFGISEVPLAVAGVVEPFVACGGAGDGGAEHVGVAQHRQDRKVSAEGPAPDADASGVEVVGEPFGHSPYGGGLVVCGPDPVMKGPAVPDGAVPGGAASVADDDDEPLVGKPLRSQVGVSAVEDAPPVRAAVGVHQHRKPTRPRHVTGREQHRGGHAAVPGPERVCLGDQRRPLGA